MGEYRGSEVWGSVLFMDIGAFTSHVIMNPCRCHLLFSFPLRQISFLPAIGHGHCPMLPQGEAAQKPGDVGRDNDIVPKSLGGVIL
jgi:hypothetical protein